MKSRWVIVVGLSAAVALLVGLTLQGLRASSELEKLEPGNASIRPASSPPSSVEAPAVPGELPTETPPWRATPQNTGALPPGAVPAWQVNPPPPDPSIPPPSPREPANPALHRPPMDNPGGVNSDRPERQAPGSAR